MASQRPLASFMIELCRASTLSTIEIVSDNPKSPPLGTSSTCSIKKRRSLSDRVAVIRKVCRWERLTAGDGLNASLPQRSKVDFGSMGRRKGHSKTPEQPVEETSTELNTNNWCCDNKVVTSLYHPKWRPHFKMPRIQHHHTKEDGKTGTELRSQKQ